MGKKIAAKRIKPHQIPLMWSLSQIIPLIRLKIISINFPLFVFDTIWFGVPFFRSLDDQFCVILALFHDIHEFEKRKTNGSFRSYLRRTRGAHKRLNESVQHEFATVLIR